MLMKEVNRRLKLSAPTLAHRRFRNVRLAGLNDQLNPARPHSYNEELIADLLHAVLTRKPQIATQCLVQMCPRGLG